MQRLVDTLRAYAAPTVVHLVMQTNGTLLDAEWLDLLAHNSIRFGISLDGPPEHSGPQGPRGYRLFNLMLTGLMGGRVTLDALVGDLQRLCVVESDGSIGISDTTRICGGEHARISSTF